jgi:NADH dehydrogenase FAD-containing subunit
MASFFPELRKSRFSKDATPADSLTESSAASLHRRRSATTTKGSIAVVGKSLAVLQTRNIHLAGYFAWLAWAFVHLRAWLSLNANDCFIQ